MSTLYITDLDGTLLTPDAKITDYAKDVIRRVTAKEGVYFSIATARGISSSFKLLQGVQVNAPLVLMNGVCIYDFPSQKYLHVCSFTPEQAHEIVSIFQKHQKYPHMYAYADNRMLVYHGPLELEVGESKKAIQHKENDPFNEFHLSLDFSKEIDGQTIVSFSTTDREEVVRPIYNEIRKIPDVNVVLYQSTYLDGIWFLEAYHKSADKSSGAKYVKDLLKIDDVVAFGDNYNDMEMFRNAERCYAVENAVPELKDIATGIAPGCADDGVPKKIAEDFLAHYGSEKNEL